MRWLIRLLCPPGALVLDPFTGSGTTGGAALLENTRFLGFEQDAEYINIARARIQHHEPRVPLTLRRPNQSHGVPRSRPASRPCPLGPERRRRHE